MMFVKTAVIAAFVASVSALTVETPTDWTSGGPANLSWTTASGDPSTFSVELHNPILFNNDLALANNVDPSLQTISFTLNPVASGAGYTVRLVNISNINQIFSESGSFSIAPEVSSSTTPSSTVASTVSSASGSGTASRASGSSAATSSSGFGTTVPAASSTSPSSAASSGGSSSAASTSPAATGNTFNGAYSIASGLSSWMVTAIGAIAGGIFVL